MIDFRRIFKDIFDFSFKCHLRSLLIYSLFRELIIPGLLRCGIVCSNDQLLTKLSLHPSQIMLPADDHLFSKLQEFYEITHPLMVALKDAFPGFVSSLVDEILNAADGKAHAYQYVPSLWWLINICEAARPKLLRFLLRHPSKIGFGVLPKLIRQTDLETGVKAKVERLVKIVVSARLIESLSVNFPGKKTSMEDEIMTSDSLNVPPASNHQDPAPSQRKRFRRIKPKTSHLDSYSRDRDTWRPIDSDLRPLDLSEYAIYKAGFTHPLPSSLHGESVFSSPLQPELIDIEGMCIMTDQEVDECIDHMFSETQTTEVQCEGSGNESDDASSNTTDEYDYETEVDFQLGNRAKSAIDDKKDIKFDAFDMDQIVLF